MNIRQKVGLLCLFVMLGVSACGGKNEQTAASVDFLADGQALQNAEDSLKALPQFDGQALNVFQDVRFYGGDLARIEISIQDPANSDYIDRYVYKGGRWSGPQPVRISGNGRMQDNVTALEQIKFAKVAEMVGIWKQKARAVGSEKTEPDLFTFVLFVPDQSRYWHSPVIETPRASYDLSFHQDGTVKAFEQR
ncbi:MULTISPECIES: hypothetical protein [unclassified Neisseria]|uniref:hypothetical protein n=1 Tax=unclassified Neisseria TaxID=2623750 RepID=UPI00266577C3|nr:MULTISPECIES: hypothetical protein [unclassified Neisseria]MDO1508799.1 hypothetical protein [Neisseria sp. MVDL19-042950]MDO1515058.1 hypothetical protein [Neisseria sp. MVDL18-041461]MDO1562418.1 hypothetical protein [Neisseria sp. MVDL20-010259]